MMKRKLVVFLILLFSAFPVFAQEREDDYDYYHRLQKEYRERDSNNYGDPYYDNASDPSDDPFDNEKHYDDSPWQEPEIAREERVKNRRQPKQWQLDTWGRGRQATSEEVLQHQLEKY